MLFVARVGHRNLVQQLLPILGEGSNIIVISSLGARAVAGTPGCPVLASFNVWQPCRAPGGLSQSGSNCAFGVTGITSAQSMIRARLRSDAEVPRARVLLRVADHTDLWLVLCKRGRVFVFGRNVVRKTGRKRSTREHCAVCEGVAMEAV
jgi:hypothetical protein